MAYINGVIQRLTDNEIKTLEAVGFKRWTKGDFDRLYIDPIKIGLMVDRYRTGNIAYAEWQGEKISNNRAKELINTKVFIDVTDGEVVSKWPMLEEAALKLAELSIVREEA